MQPSVKSSSIAEALERFSGRTTAITNNRCLPQPSGCGNLIREADFRSLVERREYAISGYCPSCQRRIFNYG